MSKHTAGEWRTGRTDMQSYEGGSGLPFVQIYADDERGKWHLGERLPIVIARLVGEEIDLDELWANARLVAASQRLLAACIKAREANRDNLKMYAYKNEPILMEAFQEVEKAIRSATWVDCPECGGHNACSTCGGSGGGDDGPHVCPNCGGSGHCQNCTDGKIDPDNQP